MPLRLLPALVLLGACSATSPAAPPAASAAPPGSAAAASTPPLQLEARRRVSWGYGCGGNCAQNTRGESTVKVTANGSDLRVEDAGNTATTFSSPGSLRTSARSWKLSWRGTLEDGDTAMTLRLASGSGTCEESQDKGTVACKHPAPARLSIACTRAAVDVEDAKRPVWRCEPDPAIPGGEWSGTPFPWVFGIDDSIDTVHAGEPQPRTTYELSRPRSGSPP